MQRKTNHTVLAKVHFAATMGTASSLGREIDTHHIILSIRHVHLNHHVSRAPPTFVVNRVLKCSGGVNTA